MNRQSLPTSPFSNQIWKIINQSKVSGPESNHDYISYSDIKKFNIDEWKRTFDFLGPRKNSSSDCWSWMLYRNPSLFLSKGSQDFFLMIFFLFVMVMQCKRSEIRLFLMMKRAFILCEISFMKTRNVGNVRRRLSVYDGQIPTVVISLKAQTERIYGLLEGVKLSHFSANQKDGAQCCYNLTTKKLCVELQPLRVGHGGTASADAPHHCNRRGASPYTHCTSGILLSKVETNKVLGHDHFLFSFSFS
jgi:hypothetical protein